MRHTCQNTAVVQGGYETTASALGFAIYNLAANPDKAAKLMQARTSPANISQFPSTIAAPLLSCCWNI